MAGNADLDLATVVELEKKLLRPQTRRDWATLAALIHDDFYEIGASGCVYERESVIELLLAERSAETQASGFEATRLGPGVVLLTYWTDTPAVRTSIWLKANDGTWQIVHHQGTPISRQAGDS